MKLIIPATESLGKSTAERCSGCDSTNALNITFAYAFQPIVDIRSRTIYAREALVRGINGEPASSILSQVNDTNRYRFDQACRVEAVKTAAGLGMQEKLSINFLPNAVYQPAACIRTTLNACKKYGFPTGQIIFEVAEGEHVDDRPHLINIFKSYEKFGFSTAIDDFGAGYAGLNLLSEYQPDIVKIDMNLVRNIERDSTKQAIVRGILLMCGLIDMQVIAEGVETTAERDYLAGIGVYLMQGYLFCKPSFRSLGTVDPMAWP